MILISTTNQTHSIALGQADTPNCCENENCSPLKTSRGLEPLKVWPDPGLIPLKSDTCTDHLVAPAKAWSIKRKIRRY